MDLGRRMWHKCEKEKNTKGKRLEWNGVGTTSGFINTPYIVENNQYTEEL